MDDSQLRAAVSQMVDRQAIVDCLTRYARGVDRLDEAKLRSAYHGDAQDFHGVFNGDLDGFVDWYWANHATGKQQHFLTNMTIEIEGEVAHVETYYLAFIDTGAAEASLACGRYIDRLTKRDNEWGIELRVVLRVGQVVARTGSKDDLLGNLQGQPSGSRDSADASYQRPLVPPR